MASDQLSHESGLLPGQATHSMIEEGPYGLALRPSLLLCLDTEGNHYARMGSSPIDDAQLVGEAIIVWTGWGRTSWPARNELSLVEHFGADTASDLILTVRRLEEEFYESTAHLTVSDLVEMGTVAASRFRRLHPELSDDVVEALAWCYTFDYK